MKSIQHNPGFFALLIILGLASLYVIWPYIGMFFLSLVITLVFQPLYRWCCQKVHNQVVASILTTLVVILAVILPAFVIISLAVMQATSVFTDFEQRVARGEIDLEQVRGVLQNSVAWVSAELENAIESGDISIASIVTKSASAVSQFLSKSIVPLISYSIGLIMNLFFFVMMLIFLLPELSSLIKVVEEVLPMSARESHQFVRKFKVVTIETLKSTVIIAVAQGFLGGIMFWILDIPASVFWAVMMGVASIVPLGSGIIWVPASIILMLTGNFTGGLILLLWGMLVISSSDNIVRAKILGGGEAQLPEVLTLLSAVGGIAMFGFFGFIFGPIVVALFLTALKIYRKNIVPEKII